MQGDSPIVARAGPDVGHVSGPSTAIKLDQVKRPANLGGSASPHSAAARREAGPVNSSRQPRRSAWNNSGSGATSQRSPGTTS